MHWRLRAGMLALTCLPGFGIRAAADAQSVAPLRKPHDSRAVTVSSITTTATDSAAIADESAAARRMPRYASVAVSSADAELLRRAYGIEDPERLYFTDSTEDGTLKYDTQRKQCLGCLVNTYHIGYVSVRQPGESWEQAERRVRSAPAKVFTGSPRPASTSTADLDPDIQPLADAMLRDAKEAGFRLHVMATYRSPLRQAFLMAKGKGRTHTLTSNHSYGRALDIVIDNGNRANPRTKRDWIAFRRWITEYHTATGERFHVLGEIDRSWDWAHVELPSPAIGFHSIDDAIARARACLASDATVSCDVAPHLPAYIGHTIAQ
jgi:hypothetical protein